MTGSGLMKYAVVAALVAPALSGCVAAAVVGAGATVGTAAASDRGVDGAARDVQIDAGVRKALGNAGHNLFRDANITVRERRVLLTGAVESEAAKQAGAEAASHVEYVVQVINRMEVNPNHSMHDSLTDTAIKNDISGHMLIDAQVKSRNYQIDVVDGHVYIMGIAENAAERKRVEEWCHSDTSVKSVEDFSMLKDDPRRAAP